MRIGVDPHLVEICPLLAGQRIEFADLFDLVSEEADPPGHVLVMAGEHFQAVAAHAEIAAGEGMVVALVLQGHQLADDFALVLRFAGPDVEDHGGIGFDRADAIQAGYRGDDDHIVPFQKRAGGRMAHPVNRLVNAAFLLDVGVAARDIGFGLVVIVIGYEIFHRVVWKEAFEFTV